MPIKGFTLCIHVYITILSTFNLFNSNFYKFCNQILWVVIKKYKFSNIIQTF